MAKKSNLSQNLHQLMSQASISEALLARKSGVPQPTINRILSSNTQYPRGDTLKKLANIFAVDINTLLGNAPLPLNRIPGAHNPKSRSFEVLPEISWEIAPKWSSFKNDLYKKGWKNWISTDAEISPDAFALSAEGEAMAPYFIEGTKLIIDPSRKPKDRDFVIICSKGQSKATLKQLFFDGEDRYLKPLNPQFKMTQMGPFDKLLGVMVQARIDFRG